jgi:hypothetical protein
MADKAHNGQGGAANGFAFPMAFNFEQLMKLNRPALTAMAEMNGKVYENVSTLNKTWVSFLNRRLKEDLAVPQQLASCKNLQDMMGVYRGFFQNAIADYQAELEELSKLGKSMTEETVAALQNRFEETTRDVRNGMHR